MFTKFSFTHKTLDFGYKSLIYHNLRPSTVQYRIYLISVFWQNSTRVLCLLPILSLPSLQSFHISSLQLKVYNFWGAPLVNLLNNKIFLVSKKKSVAYNCSAYNWLSIYSMSRFFSQGGPRARHVRDNRKCRKFLMWAFKLFQT